MRKLITHGSRKRLALSIGLLIILSLAFCYAWHLYFKHFLPERRVSTVYLPTECQVINSRLSETGRAIHKYRADFLISYSVAAVQYNRWVTGNSLNTGYYHSKRAEEALLGKYKLGETYTCWYDPNRPQMSILVRSQTWLIALPLVFSLLVGLFALYYFIKHVTTWCFTFPKRKKSRK